MLRALAAAITVLVALGAAASGAEEGPMANLVPYDSASDAGGWQRWFPRDEVAPKLAESAEDGGTLRVEGGGVKYVIGGWQREVKEFKAGDRLHVHAEVRCAAVADPLRALWIRVYWSGDLPGGTAPDVIRLEKAAGDLYVFDDTVTVPKGAASALVRLIYRWEPAGRATWRNISVLPAPPEKPHRKVRISTVYWRPSEETTVDNNLENFLGMVDKAAAEKPDIILLGEGIVSVGVGFRDMSAVSEELPGGRFFAAFAEKAKRYGCYLCYGTYERDGAFVFNTAVLIDPAGKLVGKYRKIHLPIEEDVAGLAPGSDFDVFDTPLGRIGMMICFDSAYPESARVLALKGAEIILVPIWGGDEEQVKVEAKENGVHIVTSSFDMKCMIVDPLGNVLAATFKDLGTGVATADCDLDDRTKQPWTGNWRSYMRRLRRPQAYGAISEGGR